MTLEVGERIVQGVFMPFLIVDGDEADGVRTGGFGSAWTVEESKVANLFVSNRYAVRLCCCRKSIS